MVVESGGVAQLGAAPRRRGARGPRNNGLMVVESGGVAQLGAAPQLYGLDVDGDGRADYIVHRGPPQAVVGVDLNQNGQADLFLQGTDADGSGIPDGTPSPLFLFSLSSLPLFLSSHSHTLTITCTCCYDEIEGTQDQDFSC